MFERKILVKDFYGRIDYTGKLDVHLSEKKLH